MSFWEQLKKLFVKARGCNFCGYEGQYLELTPRELDVFRLLLEGYTLQECADQLDIKYSTANTHMTAIYKKLDVNSRSELIIRYRDFNKEK